MKQKRSTASPGKSHECNLINGGIITLPVVGRRISTIEFSGGEP